MRYPKFALSCLFNLSVFLGTKIDRKRYQKFNQKSIKNPSKIDQKSIKIRPKIIQNRGWGGSWSLSGRLGRVLGHLAAFWARLEASWERLGRRPSCVLGRPGGVLGGFGVFLGPLGVSWGSLGLDFLAKWGKIEALHLGWHFPIDH